MSSSFSNTDTGNKPADPYTEAGVIAQTTVREWDVVVGAWL